MARTEKKSRNSKKGLIAWIMMLLTGSGAGAGLWQYREHLLPVLRALGLPVDTATRLPILSTISEKSDSLIRRTNYESPGRFEVVVRSVELPSTLFPAGSTLELDLRVLRYDRHGQETIVWDTFALPRRSVTIASSPATASWAEHPFRVNWSPGDRFAFEVWNRRGLRPSKLYVLPVRDAGSFPFQTGSWPLARWSRSGIGPPDPVASVTFETKRLALEPDPPRLARQRPARRADRGDDDPIIIR
ncbi:MAG: hypothetical protein KatS3mg108_1123 [Isosphaeraceae bacterium]|jgi:hypothetical protein|nr:MAG: hypothetical protein KatS3mg108_1123 [Isosphaeraceae bacterium]